MTSGRKAKMNIYPLQEPSDTEEDVLCWDQHDEKWFAQRTHSMAIGDLWRSIPSLGLDPPSAQLQEEAKALPEKLDMDALRTIEQLRTTQPGWELSYQVRNCIRDEWVKRLPDGSFYKTELGLEVLREYEAR